MTEICVRRPVDDRSVALLRDVAAVAATHDGHPALGDGVERDLAARGSASAIVLALDGARAVAAMHLSTPDGAGDVTGTLVLAPEARTGTVGRAVVHAACDDVTSRGPARLEYWVFGASGETDLGAEPPVRELYEMRVALPLARPAAEPTWPEGVRVRAFVVPRRRT